MANGKFNLATKFQELQGNKEQFREFIDALPMAIYTTDAEGKLTHYNKAAVEFSGREPELGSDSWCVTWKLYKTDGTPLPHENCPMAVALKEGRAILGEEAIAETPDGKRRWFEAYPSPLLDSSGKVTGGVNMLVDVSERKEYEKAITENEQRLKMALEAGGIGSWEWNINTNEVLWSSNLEKLHGMKPGEFDGTFESFLNAVHPDDREELSKLLKKSLKDGSPYEIEHRWIHKSGKVLWFKGKGKVIHDNAGKPSKMIGTCTDITSEKQNEQLQDVQMNLLKQIATGTPLDECLSSICSAVCSLSRGMKSAIILTDPSGNIFEQVISHGLKPSFAEDVKGIPVLDKRNGTCTEAIQTKQTVNCLDISSDKTRSKEWRELCNRNGFNACSSNPILNENGHVFGTFLICFDDTREPNKWEKELSDFGTHVAGIALERDKSRYALEYSEGRFRQMMQQSPLSMQIFNAVGESILVNPAWERLWSTSKEEIGEYNILKDEQLKASGLNDEVKKAFNGEVVKLPLMHYDPAKTGKRGRPRWIEGFLYPLTSVDDDGFEVALVHHDVTTQKETEEALIASESKLEAELTDSTLLQELSLQLIEEENIESLYEKILDAASRIMKSEFASLQLFHPERGSAGELSLLANRGFSSKAEKLWKWVSPASDSICGKALKNRQRVIVEDVYSLDSLKGTDDLKVYKELGIKSVQSTPLHSRNGNLLGMISTHWKKQHKPDKHHLRLLDILARQAADLMERKQAEKELKKSEHMYRTLFESIEEGYCIIKMIFDENDDPVDYLFLEANPACEQIMEMENVVGKTMKEIFPAMDNKWFEIYGKVAKSGEPANFEEFTNRIQKWLQVYAFRFGKPEEGKVAVLFSDITARKENDHATSLINAIVDGTDDAIISKDLNGYITSWNKSAQRLFGYTEEEAIGQHITMLIPKERLDEEDLILSKIRNGERVSHFETKRISKDGRLIDLSLTVSPVHDSDGNIIGASKVARDITDYKQAEKEREKLLHDIERERHLLADVFQNAPSFMAILKGPNHIFEQANDFYYKLVGNRELIGKSVAEALPETVNQGFTDLLDKVYATGEAYSGTEMTLALQRDENTEPEERYLDFVYQPVFNSAGEIEGVFVQGNDLTERIKAKAELQRINETLEERVEERTAALLSYQDQLRSLASQLSKTEEQVKHQLASDLHDNLGQLLAVGKMKLDLLKKCENPEEANAEMQELTSLMNEAIRYTRELMTDLKPPPSLDKENIGASLEWIAEKMSKHNLEVVFAEDDLDKPLKEEVRTTLRQCVKELLFNVVKHSGTDKAHLVLSRQNDFVKVVVEDKGKGFNHNWENISPSDEGGFGLFNIRERMHILDGNMQVISKEGKGTKIILQAPLESKAELDIPKKQDEEKQEEPSESQVKEDNQKITVLLVDDHQMMRRGLRKMIDSQDDLMVIAEAADGKDALKVANQTNPDVIVMDVNMPGMNGIEATREVMSSLPHIRVIGLSLHDNPDVAEAMRSAGAVAYLTKSEAFETLCATIRSEAQLVD